jgi:hypothetical protein
MATKQSVRLQFSPRFAVMIVTTFREILSPHETHRLAPPFRAARAETA